MFILRVVVSNADIIRVKTEKTLIRHNGRDIKNTLKK